ncbi:MAG: hydantoinase/oxoprolinase family protein [Roseiflexaceae bacterium]|nr:hydantoinase/oxoprolinase family protein [Roseiflexaceae bacterium]
MDILGIDIGGTFTDFVLLRDGHVRIYKTLSTPDDPARALIQGVDALGAPKAVVHGTTVATNALLERRGAATALITTDGFGDVLTIGRGNRPALYDLNVTRPDPPVPDAWRFELVERMLPDGRVLIPLSDDELARLVTWIETQPVESVAICLLHSYVNSLHEEQVAAALEQAARAARRTLFISASHRVLPEPREYERTSTTVVNAYVSPILGRYLDRLGPALTERGVESVRIMASDGGSMGLVTARELAARATLSGPAGGIVGAWTVARRAGFSRIISFDMGGTSTDVALVDGALPRTSESHVGGLPVRLPALDIHTVGAGGGSIARVDAGGALRVGPQSAGADPGPACYGKGTLPTVTDANLLLGRLQADHFLGGRMTLDVERARTAFVALAHDLFGVHDPGAEQRAALGVVRVANALMERAIRAISVERGEDPRDCALVAFGGAGPLHAAYLADALGIRTVLVPRYPGVLSALGMIAADVTRESTRALLMTLDALDPETLAAHIAALADEALAALAADGEDPNGCHIECVLDLRYVGQSYELPTPLERGWETAPAPLADLAERFHALHERRYGHAMRERRIEAVTLRVRAVSPRSVIDLAPEAPPPRPMPLAPRAMAPAALTGDTATLEPAPLYERDDLRPGDAIDGPAIIAQFDATTIAPPGWRVSVDADLNLVMTPLPSRPAPTAVPPA